MIYTFENYKRKSNTNSLALYMTQGYELLGNTIDDIWSAI